MKRILGIALSLALCLALLAGCAAPVGPEANETPDKQTVRLASLKGPTTMGLVKLLDDAKADALGYAVESGIYGTADEVTALLTSGGVDMAAIPCNLASALYNKTGGALKVAAINTLGVLYVVETGETISSVADLKGREVFSTGKGTTPEYALAAILEWNGLDPEKDLTIEFKNEATEIAAMLSLEGSDAVAVLPQPYAATVLMQNENARLALDLTEEWEKAGADGALITGVLAVNAEFAAAHPETVESFLEDYKASVDWVNANTADAAVLIESYGIVAKAAVAEKALPFCNIVFIRGAEMKNDVSSYLGVLFEQNPKAVGGALPDDAFYYGA